VRTIQNKKGFFVFIVERETAVASHEIAVPAYGYSYLATVLAIHTSVLVVASAGSAVFLLLF
jgi:hypothetical protein